ncbi:MAG: SDR family oxidoreductase [Opitutae bacterium]|nr:SDR family oxidoreductase [Opitutae bacterium]MBT5378274.1 SDR family oxidoreductase [Opitutae bacterium]MBT5691411.1 SDR family oxidoreductase [Opitutae bacterium]MBT6461467.1 SDR family oxidoreductase [Opitutae bacterium]MBT6957236.1 SDR family oxidoreductase [Opitutae bacterium]
MDQNLTEQKHALVIGGGTGMGEAIALAFSREGWRVVIAGRRLEKLEDVIRQSSMGNPIQKHVADVGERDSVETLFQWFREQVGQLDILVNCAGVNIPDRSIDKLSPSDWDDLIRINATGAFDCMRCALKDMCPRGDGLIINISSVAGKRAAPLGGVAYNASKFAMTALGTTLAEEVRDAGVRITSIFPGEVNTPILDNRPEPPPETHRKRILQPEDVAAATLMVAKLPARAHIPELIIKPTIQSYF